MINHNRRRTLQQAGFGLAGLLTLHANPATGTVSGTEPTTDNITCKPLLSHALRPLMEPRAQRLCDRFDNQVLLVVNTASRCGFTPQFEGLEALYQRFADRGFQVLGFPSGDFRQELSSEQEVAEFCELNYGVSFPMFEKVSVKGQGAHPFFQDLTRAAGISPQWNFNKYLINRDASVVAHYPSNVRPQDPALIQQIEGLL